MTKPSKEKVRKALLEAATGNPDILVEHLLTENTNALNDMVNSLEYLRDTKDAIDAIKEVSADIAQLPAALRAALSELDVIPESLRDIQKVIDDANRTNHDRVVRALSDIETKLLSGLVKMQDNRPYQDMTNKMVDAINAGFRRMEIAVQNKGNEDLIKAFYDAIQPLVDQNVEKINLMKEKGLDSGSEKKQINIMGGTSGLLNKIPHSTDIQDGTATVSTAGTRVPLSSTSTMCSQVTITAHESNTGTVVVGSNTVVAAVNGRRGTPLYSTQSVTLNINDLNKVYIDSTVSGDKVTFSWLG